MGYILTSPDQRAWIHSDPRSTMMGQYSMTMTSKTAATTSMKSGGYYSESTRGAKDVIDNASGMLMDAIAALPEPSTDRALNIADFGAADGGTSKKSIRASVAAMRSKFPDRQIVVTYTDLASNDFFICLIFSSF